eukprot:PhM_4_TR505/c1_g1_i1/m.78367
MILATSISSKRSPSSSWSPTVAPRCSMLLTASPPPLGLPPPSERRAYHASNSCRSFPRLCSTIFVRYSFSVRKPVKRSCRVRYSPLHCRSSTMSACSPSSTRSLPPTDDRRCIWAASSCSLSVSIFAFAVLTSRHTSCMSWRFSISWSCVSLIKRCSSRPSASLKSSYARLRSGTATRGADWAAADEPGIGLTPDVSWTSSPSCVIAPWSRDELGGTGLLWPAPCGDADRPLGLCVDATISRMFLAAAATPMPCPPEPSTSPMPLWPPAWAPSREALVPPNPTMEPRPFVPDSPVALTPPADGGWPPAAPPRATISASKFCTYARMMRKYSFTSRRELMGIWACGSWKNVRTTFSISKRSSSPRSPSYATWDLPCSWFCICSSALSSPTSFCSCLICVESSSTTLTEASFCTFIMREANLSVDRDSSMWRASGQTFAIMVVWQLPPRESFRRFVSLLWRNGTCERFEPPSESTTCSRKLRDLLMYCASFMSCPSLPDFDRRSLPARSMQWILLVSAAAPLSIRVRLETWIV